MNTDLTKTLAVAALIALAGPGLAQDTGTGTEPAPEAEAATEATPVDPVPAETPAEPTAREPGTTYIDQVFGDWERKCVFLPDQDDHCEVYQMVKDSNDVPVAEISLLRLPDGGEAVAGATLVVPLETLLTENVIMKVDSGAVKSYPYRFCAEIGCITQIGLTAEDVSAFKRGAVANITVVPAQAPAQKAVFPFSLKGFTDAYSSLPVPAAPEAPEAPADGN